MTSDGFRPDIQGLRALAIVAVLLAHAQLPFAPGGYVGVDVFFVISGFLITGLLVRELERTGTISLKQFYARRVRRILPLAAFVLLAVVVMAALILSPVAERRVGTDVAAAAAYVVNWVFAARAIDYFAAGPASPVQHYWSLAIEEQFYLVWPGLILLATWPLRRSGRDTRMALLITVGAVAAASLAYSVAFTAEAPNAAYFSTFTRVWELALGAGIALIRFPSRVPRGVPAALGWAGLAAVAYSVLAFDARTEFPGVAALVPTLGTAALIVAGTYSASGPSRVLATGPCQYVGGISYSWYLWHWPLLIFAAELLGPLSTLQATLVVAASWIPTQLSHRFVEAPLHHSERIRRRPRRAMLLWGACTGAALVAALALVATIPSYPTARHVKGAAAQVGKEQALETSAKAIKPNPLDAAGDRGPVADDGCFLDHEQTRSPACVYGDRSSKRTVVLFGDSHAMQYFPALEGIATRRGWRLVVLTKTACTPADVTLYSGLFGRNYNECDTWREATLKRIETQEHPRMIVLSSAPPGIYEPLKGGKELTGDAAADEMAAGYQRTFDDLRPTGAEIVVIKDPAQPPQDIPTCVSRSLDRLDRCAFPLPDDYDNTFDERAAESVPGVSLVRLTKLICPDGTCPAVIGDALVYRTNGHLTATFAATLRRALARHLPPIAKR